MKHAELMYEVEQAYNTFLVNNPGHSEVDFDSFLIGYTACLHLRNKQVQEDDISYTLRQLADHINSPLAESDLMIVDNKTYISFVLKTSLNEAYIDSNNDLKSDVWENLYNRVFSDEVSTIIFRLFPDFNYHDPDTSYYEDVVAFINAFIEYAKKE